MALYRLFLGSRAKAILNPEGWDSSIPYYGFVAFSDNDRTATAAPDVGSADVFSVTKHSGGKYFAEVVFSGNYVGIHHKPDWDGAYLEGATGNVDVYSSAGVVADNYPGVFPPVSAGAVVGIAVDIDAGKVWFRVNGGPWNNDPAQSPEGPVGPTSPTDSLVITHTPAASRNDYTGEVGMRLGIGPADVPFEWIGMRYAGGSAGPYRVTVYEWFANAPIAYADIDMTGVAVGDWVWASIAPATMLANGYYSVALKVTSGDGQLWTNPGATSLKPVILNTYAIYRDSVAAGFSTGVIDTQFIGLDLGWTE
jgi:hypothetical protein